MSDAIDDFKALDEHRRIEREKAWDSREKAFVLIRALGFDVRVLSEESRHCRVALPHRGWIDFYPSTGWWQASRLSDNRAGPRGRDLGSLLSALRGLA